MSVKLSTSCPFCNKGLKVSESLIGQIVGCPGCGKKFELTSLSSDADKSLMSIQQTLDGRNDITTDEGFAQPKKSGDGVALGRFHLQKVLGAGTFGKVYRAYDPQLDRLLAIKVPTFSSKDRSRVEKFLSEAKSAAQLRHPNIVPTFESGFADGRYFIAAQFIDGQPLSTLLKSGDFDQREALEWVVSLAEAVMYAHSCDIVHRDIKPHNVMIDEDGEPQLMDFGLAGRAGDDTTKLKDGVAVGTPAYMPPEQARGDTDAIGPWSDQYSIGVILYEILTGQRPFFGDPQSVVQQVIEESPPRPRAMQRSIPRDLEAICRKAMEREPEDRYASCQDLADDLSRWLRGESTQARPLFFTRQLWRWGKKNPFAFAAGAVCTAAIVSVACLAFAFALQKEQENTEVLAAKKDALDQKSVAEKAVEVLKENERRLNATIDQKNDAVASEIKQREEANRQAGLVAEQREKTQKLLLESQLQKAEFFKRQNMLPEAVVALSEAIEVGEQIADRDRKDAMKFDLAFTKSLIPVEEVMDPGLPGDVERLNDRFGIQSADRIKGRVFEIATGKAFGMTFQLPSRASQSDERLLKVWATSDSLFWAALAADKERAYWKNLRVHRVLLETATLSSVDGPDIQPIAVKQAGVPVWISNDGSTIAFRSLQDSQKISAVASKDFSELRRIESREIEFLDAALSHDGRHLTICERDDRGRTSVVTYVTDKDDRKTVARQAEFAAVHPEMGLIAVGTGESTRLYKLAGGNFIAELPVKRQGLYAADTQFQWMAVLEGNSVSVHSPSGMASYRLPDGTSPQSLRVVGDGLIQLQHTGRTQLLDVEARLATGTVSFHSNASQELIPREPKLKKAEQATCSFNAGLSEFGGFVADNRMLLLEPEESTLYAATEGIERRFRIRHFKQMSLFDFHTCRSNRVTVPGFMGKVELEAISTNVTSADQRKKTKQNIDDALLQRLIASHDAITLSNDGALAVIRDVSSAQRLMTCSTETGQFFGDYHLTFRYLTTHSYNADQQGFAGPARFDRSDRLYFYRATEDSLGIVDARVGKRTGPSLALPSNAEIVEAGWTADSSRIWCLCSDVSKAISVIVYDVVTGDSKSLTTPRLNNIRLVKHVPVSDVLFVSSDEGRYFTLDIGTAKTTQGISGPDGSDWLNTGVSNDGQWIFATGLNAPSRMFTASATSVRNSTTSLLPAGEKDCIVIPTLANGQPLPEEISLPHQLSAKANRVAFWQFESDNLTPVELRLTTPLRRIAFSHGLGLAITVEQSGTTRLWHVASGHALGPPLDLIVLPPDTNTLVNDLSYIFAPDENQILVKSKDEIVALIPLPQVDIPAGSSTN
ncbi:MAG: serine/threonine protein kinase [Planctomycetaceae bacterium]|nr:serine/threonine protein kinase [Planctomycetaceae bacterium]